ncbi:MAG: hypothetical protein IPI00_13535 [Flavobacteriales bacterium]|nr:hypothetical protein [Flavobacteriales bacterium]MBK6944696.1 hypothetical protein [Flavobacteriales bacterium]MBK7241156.1 hypothetical protein [Flavobacteriales bacterium]MBK7295694.1 hypothetical protein [Flavobacteriales bacterium]MBK9534350.1 hypothetical protein [Flavobacteriales bacterium]
MAKKKTHISKKELLKIEKGAVRKEQKEQGALDGRFREKMVPNKKRKAQRKRDKDIDAEDL